MADEELATIKHAGETEYISKAEFERRILEIARCKRDIIYFAEKYFKIINLDKGLTTIKLYDKQKDLLRFFTGEKRCIVLASRQSSKCVGFWTSITVKHKIYPLITLKLPIGVFYLVNKILSRRFSNNIPANLVDNSFRKFVDILDVSNWQVLTDDGFVDIRNINKTIRYQKYKVETESGKSLICADTHILIDEYGKQVFAKDSLNSNIKTIDGVERVVSVSQFNSSIHMFDLELTSNSNHLYYTDGLLSHNTTTYTIYALWLTMFHSEKKIMLLANKADTALEILSRIRMAYEYCPSFLKPGVATWNKGEVIFANRSSIKGFATSSDAARGHSCNVVIADEFSFVPNNIASKVFESIYPVISSSKNSQFIIVSTPNGADMKNLYYEIWQKANSKTGGKNIEGWKPFRFDWWDVPGRDEQWKLNTIASIGQKRFDQEFGNQFLTSSSIKKLIDDDIIENYRIKLSEYKTQNIIPKKQRIISEAEDEIFSFDMWHEFQPSKTYLASMDISEGTGNDSSVLYIWDVSDLSNIIMCAKFSSDSVSLVQFAYISSKILALYNNPFLAAERNGVSAGTLDSLKITYGYRNIAIENKKDEAGIFSHVQNKSKACLWCREMMTTKGFGFTIYDKDLLEEMTIFCRKDTKGGHLVYQALPGPDSHDDHMMAFIWMTYMLQNDIIDKYFVTVKTFRSELDKIYPQIIQPLHEYLSEDYIKIKNDPLYKDFIDFKNEMMAKIGKTYKAQQESEKADIFKYQQIDPYFDDDWGPSWTMNTPNSPTQITMNPQARMPIYAII